MTIKLIAIDMDGTLLNENSQLNLRTLQAVKAAKKAGIKIVIATGRPLIGVTPFLHELELLSPGDFVITYNGALVQAADSGAVIVRHTLDYQEFLDIEYMARKIGVHCHTEDEHYIYTANRDLSMYTVNESHLVNMPILYRTPDEMDPTMEISKMMLIDEPIILNAAQAKLPESFTNRFHLVKSMPFYLEVLNKEASKGNGLRDLATHLNFDVSELMAIGDQNNDRSMLEFAGTSVAMGNAIDEIKAITDLITETNINDGVAVMIEQVITTNQSGKSLK